MKTCNKCRRVLPASAFNTRLRHGRPVLMPRCVKCTRDDNREAQQTWLAAPENRAKANAKTRAWDIRPENKTRAKDLRLRKDYGITLADWQAKLAAQGGLCAICGRPMTERINVDHDHKTGEVRDLLCSPCNGGLGCFRDDPALLVRAEAYLNRWGRK